MNILIVGGAGHVGGIIRPALEARYDCYYYDRRPVVGAEGRSIIADIDDTPRLQHAMAGMQAVINVTLGVPPESTTKDVNDLDTAFNVNVRGAYRVLATALKAGVRRFIHASSLSVYHRVTRGSEPIDESVEPDSWDIYGFTKRLSEETCRAAGQRYPDAGIVMLRLMFPCDEETFAKQPPLPPDVHWYPTGPNDTRRLFLAALEYTAHPGCHVFQATGELKGAKFPYRHAEQVLGWKPRGE